MLCSAPWWNNLPSRWSSTNFSNIFCTFLDEQFPARWIGRWSPHDLPDFFLWRLVKDQVYMAPMHDLADSEERIYAAVSNITPQMLDNTWVQVEYRLDISRATNGSHVEVYRSSSPSLSWSSECSAQGQVFHCNLIILMSFLSFLPFLIFEVKTSLGTPCTQNFR